MKFAKTVAVITCLVPLTTYAASPFDAMIASLNSIDSTLTSSSSASTTTNQSLQSLNTSTNALNATMQTLNTSTSTLNMSVQSLNTSTSTLNTTNTTLNSSTANLNQTNGALSTSVQSLDQKINSLQGSVDSLKASIDSLAANAGGGSSSGGGSGGSGNGRAVADMVYVSNCTISTPLKPTTQNKNYRCDELNRSTMLLSKLAGQIGNTTVGSDVIFEVPPDKHFVMTDFSTALTTTNSTEIYLKEVDLSNNEIIKKPVSFNEFNDNIYTTRSSNYSSAQGGMVFKPGSKVVLEVLTNRHAYGFSFEMTGYLVE